MSREIIPPPAKDEIDPNWTASQAMAERLNHAKRLADEGLAVGESYNKLAQLYGQESRIAAEQGQPFPDFETWMRERAQLRLQQGYRPLSP